MPLYVVQLEYDRTITMRATLEIDAANEAEAIERAFEEHYEGEVDFEEVCDQFYENGIVEATARLAEEA
jgi:uncharacterized protein YbcV (DUF1398 family)